MNADRIKEVFKDQFEQLAGASVREGSVIVDQIIDPILLLNLPLYERVEDLLNQAAAPYGETPTDLLDLVGERFFTERVRGSRVRASVVVRLNRPTRIEIKESTRFFTQGRREYRPRQTYVFNRSDITEDESGRFVTPSIEVIAVEEGSDYSVSEGEIQITSLSKPEVISAHNPAPSTDGLTEESDEEYYERIRRAISSRAMDTPRGLIFRVNEQFAGQVNRITIIGAGDTEMQRDVQKVLFSSREVPLTIQTQVER